MNRNARVAAIARGIIIGAAGGVKGASRIAMGFGADSSPRGTADCSHGWSGAAAKPPDAQPLDRGLSHSS